MFVCSLAAHLLAACSSEETVPKKVVKPTELPLEFNLAPSNTPSDSNKTEAVYTMSGKSMDTIHAPKNIKLKKSERAFTISLSTKPVGESIDDSS